MYAYTWSKCLNLYIIKHTQMFIDAMLKYCFLLVSGKLSKTRILMIEFVSAKIGTVSKQVLQDVYNLKKCEGTITFLIKLFLSRLNFLRSSLNYFIFYSLLRLSFYIYIIDYFWTHIFIMINYFLNYLFRNLFKYLLREFDIYHIMFHINKLINEHSILHFID